MNRSPLFHIIYPLDRELTMNRVFTLLGLVSAAVKAPTSHSSPLTDTLFHSFAFLGYQSTFPAPFLLSHAKDPCLLYPKQITTSQTLGELLQNLNIAVSVHSAVANNTQPFSITISLNLPLSISEGKKIKSLPPIHYPRGSCRIAVPDMSLQLHFLRRLEISHANGMTKKLLQQ